MSLHHAERFTLAEIIGFAGGLVFVGLDVNDMGMIVSFTGVIAGAVAVIIGADNIIPVPCLTRCCHPSLVFGPACSPGCQLMCR